MNWIHFLLWLSAAYSLYYLLNILYDVAGNRYIPAAKSPTNELLFSEIEEPIFLEHRSESDSENGMTENTKPETQAEVIASGGVSIKNLYNLARKDLIIYTRSVTY